MNSDLIKNKKFHLLGLPIHDFTISELIDEVESAILRDQKYIIYGFSGGIYPRLKDIPEFVVFFNQMDIIVSDGAGTLLLSKLFSVPLRGRVGIPNLSYKLLDLAHERKLKVFLFGASQEVNHLACKNIKKKYLGIEDCKGINGYFTEVDEQKILDQINQFNPDILLIGISSPMKERFALKYKNKLNANIILPCGGVIDVLAGKAKRPPGKIAGLPLTWLFRFIQEPRRLFSTTIKLVFQLVFHLIPVLYFKHFTEIERNPSIVKYYNLDVDLNIDYSELAIK